MAALNDVMDIYAPRATPEERDAAAKAAEEARQKASEGVKLPFD
jgi:hypothetical protein